MIPCQKDKYKLEEGVAYLNCASMSPLLNSVVAAMHTGIDRKVRPYQEPTEVFFSTCEDARNTAAQLIGTDADNIAIVPSASYGLQTAANNLPLRKDGEILVVEEQFPSNIYPWRDKAAKCGGHINTVARPINQDWTAAVLEAIGPQTEIIALPATHWIDGGVFDLEVIGMAGRAAGARLVLDLTQSLGAMPFNIDRVEPDFMVVAGYKWLMGPYSSGYLYAAPRWHKGEPLENNWMNRAGSDDYARLVDYQDRFRVGARRYDMGEKGNAVQMLGSTAGMKQLLHWGVDNISETLGKRNKGVAARARELGMTIVDDHLRSPHYVGLGFPGGMPDGLHEHLSEKGIYVSLRGDFMRVTPHLYNTDDDVDRLFRVLETHR